MRTPLSRCIVLFPRGLKTLKVDRFCRNTGNIREVPGYLRFVKLLTYMQKHLAVESHPRCFRACLAA